MDDKLQSHLLELNNATLTIASFLEEWKSYLNNSVDPLYLIYDGLLNLQSYLQEMVWNSLLEISLYFC